MVERVQEGFMVFLADGASGIAAVRRIQGQNLVIYVENAGEFTVKADAIRDVHSQKVLLNPQALSPDLLEAIRKIRLSEDRSLVG